MKNLQIIKRWEGVKSDIDTTYKDLFVKNLSDNNQILYLYRNGKKFIYELFSNPEYSPLGILESVQYSAIETNIELTQEEAINYILQRYKIELPSKKISKINKDRQKAYKFLY